MIIEAKMPIICRTINDDNSKNLLGSSLYKKTLIMVLSV